MNDTRPQGRNSNELHESDRESIYNIRNKLLHHPLTKNTSIINAYLEQNNGDEEMKGSRFTFCQYLILLQRTRTPPTKNKKIHHNPFAKNIHSQILEGNSIPCKSIDSFTDIATHPLTFYIERQANDTYCIEPGFIFHPHTKNNLITFRCFCFVYSPMRTF